MAKQVLVLEGLSLLTKGVATLLRQVEGLEVIEVDLDQPGAGGRVATEHPETVIVDRVDIEGAEEDLLLHLLQGGPKVKVLCLDIAGPVGELYQHQRLAIGDVQALMQALQAEYEEGGAP